jgi:hypothetical protein
MSYDPHERTPSPRQVAAAWIVCAGLCLLAFGQVALEAHAASRHQAEALTQVCGIDMLGSENRTGCLSDRVVRHRA